MALAFAMKPTGTGEPTACPQGLLLVRKAESRKLRRPSSAGALVRPKMTAAAVAAAAFGNQSVASVSSGRRPRIPPPPCSAKEAPDSSISPGQCVDGTCTDGGSTRADSQNGSLGSPISSSSEEVRDCFRSTPRVVERMDATRSELAKSVVARRSTIPQLKPGTPQIQAFVQQMLDPECNVNNNVNNDSVKARPRVRRKTVTRARSSGAILGTRHRTQKIDCQQHEFMAHNQGDAQPRTEPPQPTIPVLALPPQAQDILRFKTADPAVTCEEPVKFDTACEQPVVPAEICAKLRLDAACTPSSSSSTAHIAAALGEEVCSKLRCAASSSSSTAHIASALGEDKMSKAWREQATYHTHGKMTKGQLLGDERERLISKGEGFIEEPPVVISCQKGCKGTNDVSPNQDNFSITYFNNGYSIACCFDGHGEFGHLVSTRTVQTVPYFLLHSKSFPNDVPKALTEAFERAQEDVTQWAKEEGWDVSNSGSTAVAAVWHGSKVWTANAGDSRCVIGSAATSSIVFETSDHKPDSLEELQRIEQNGGEVRTVCYEDGEKVSRVYVRGTDSPGLCMSRSLGDNDVKSVGVIATPEISCCEVDLSQSPFLLLASDGVWDFVDSNLALRTITKKMHQDGMPKRVQKLQREARKRWRQAEGSYCDDITSVFVQLHQGKKTEDIPLSDCQPSEEGSSSSDFPTPPASARTPLATARLPSAPQKVTSWQAQSHASEVQSQVGIKSCMEKSYADLRTRMANYTKDPSAIHKQLMEESCAELKAWNAKLSAGQRRHSIG